MYVTVLLELATLYLAVRVVLVVGQVFIEGIIALIRSPRAALIAAVSAVVWGTWEVLRYAVPRAFVTLGVLLAIGAVAALVSGHALW